MHFERLVSSFAPLQQLLIHVRLTCSGQERRQHVLVTNDTPQDRARLDLAGPADETWNAPSSLIVSVFLPAERRVGAIGPSVILGPVVGGVHHDGVISDSKVVEFVEHLADLLVMGHHPVTVVVLPALTTVLGGKVGPEVHCGRVVPEEERFVRFGLLLHPSERSGSDLLIDSFHTLLGQRAGVLNRLLAYSSKPG